MGDQRGDDLTVRAYQDESELDVCSDGTYRARKAAPFALITRRRGDGDGGGAAKHWHTTNAMHSGGGGSALITKSADVYTLDIRKSERVEVKLTDAKDRVRM